MTPTIRPETTADHEAIRHVNRVAFGQDDEAGIVDALRNGGYDRLSLVAEVNRVVVGHILFSDLPILTDSGAVMALSLAPMAVLPEFQKRGIGSALVQMGLEACRRQGHRIVVVLGHPHFYPRFGFSAKLAEPLSSPFSGRDSWMAMELVPGALEGVSGWVQYPLPFGIEVQMRPPSPSRPSTPITCQPQLVQVSAEQVQLVAPLFDAYRQFYGQSSDLEGARRFLAERLGRGESVLFAAVEDGQALGFTQLYPTFSSVSMKPVWILNDLFVAEDARRRGLGARLLHAARDHALQTGAARLVLSTAVANTTAQALYERHGWRRDTAFLHYEYEMPRESL
jgi:putative acetyltransferase